MGGFWTSRVREFHRHAEQRLPFHWALFISVSIVGSSVYLDRLYTIPIVATYDLSIRVSRLSWYQGSLSSVGIKSTSKTLIVGKPCERIGHGKIRTGPLSLPRKIFWVELYVYHQTTHPRIVRSPRSYEYQ